MKYIIRCVLGAALVLCMGAALFLLAGARQKTEALPSFGLFSWDEAVIAEEERDALASCIKQCGVNMIYQEFSEESLASGEASGFVTRMKRQSVEVYALMGEAKWAYEPKADTLLKSIKSVSDYNKKIKREARIAGVIVDVEPYLLDEWDEGGDSRSELLECYLSCMRSAYQYASQNKLKFWVCIPNFYDVAGLEINVLEELISKYCDGIAIMNYNRTDEYMQIAREVGYAREYGKGVVCIYELQQPGRHELEEINTYAEAGLDALWSSARRLEKQFGYDRLQFAYHYYKPLQNLLGK